MGMLKYVIHASEPALVSRPGLPLCKSRCEVMMHDRLVEDLVPFLDRDIHDPKASQLASHPKRKHHDSAVGPRKPCDSTQPNLGAGYSLRLGFCCGIMFSSFTPASVAEALRLIQILQ